MLVGQGGAGKTTLATELARWMHSTRRFQRLAFVSFEDVRDVRTAIDVLGRQLVASDFSVATFKDEAEALLHLDRRLSEFKTLIVLDNMESILPDADGNAPLGVEDFGKFAALFSRLKNAGASLLFTTRERLPAPFDAGRNHRYLGQLSPADALRLIAGVRRQEGLEEPPLNLEDLEKAYGVLASRLNYHARACALLARTIPADADTLTLLDADLTQLMADLERKHPGERENSLFASLELSLRRLPPAMREVVDALAVYHGGADVATWAMVAECEPQAAHDAGFALIHVGLAEYAYDKFPYYFKIDPSLPAYLAARTAPELLDARRLRWVEGMAALSGFLYQQIFQNRQLATDSCLLSEANLLAMLAALAHSASLEQLINEAGRIEELFSNLGRPQVVLFAQNIREKAAQQVGGWSHAQFIHQGATVDRLLEQGNWNAAYPLAQQVLAECERAGAQAYPGAEYDWAVAHWRFGNVLSRGGRLEQALPFFENAERRFDTLAEAGNTSAARIASVCLAEMGNCFLDLGRYDAAATQYEKSIVLSEKQNDARQVAAVKGQIASIRMYQKKYPEALRLLHEAKVTFGQYREPSMVATAWHQIGIVHQRAGNYPAAENAYRDSLAIKIREKDKAGEASSLNQLGNLYDDNMGRVEDAVQVYERAVGIYTELKDLRCESLVRNNLAQCLLQLRRPTEARTQLLRVIECDSNFGHATQPWIAWNTFCNLETSEGNPSAATAARQKAMLAYAAYRKDGGGSQSNRFNLVVATAQVLQADEVGELLLQFEGALLQELPVSVKALLRALIALLRGQRDPALADDPELHYMDAVDLKLMFFGAGE
ncbi:MAG: tetratricopeptide repeat protein [Lewinellaceae bacterium]|nr:tetratricopeptide repeat protein [Lewinellaceae bacterium]